MNVLDRLFGWSGEEPVKAKLRLMVGGGGSSSRTQSSMPVIPPEYAPLAQGQVQGLLALQQALPLTAFAQWMPRPIAPMSSYTQEFMNLVPLMQTPTWGLTTVAGLGPTVLNRTNTIAGTGGADRQNAIYQQMASRGPVYTRPTPVEGPVYRRPSTTA